MGGVKPMTVSKPTPINPDIKGYECKHAIYVEAQDGSDDDMVFVKERIHYADGHIEPNTRIFENFKQDFYITKKNFQNHKDKKEWEDIDRLQKFSSTRRKLPYTIAKLLGRNLKNASLRRLAQSPYLYGCDIATPVLIKRRYMDRSPDCISTNHVAVLDIETDVVHGTEEIILISVTYKDRIICAYTDAFLGSTPNALEKLHHAANE